MIRDDVWSFSQDNTTLYCVLHNLRDDAQIPPNVDSRNDYFGAVGENAVEREKLNDNKKVKRFKASHLSIQKSCTNFTDSYVDVKIECDAIKSVEIKPNDITAENSHSEDNTIVASVLNKNRKNNSASNVRKKCVRSSLEQKIDVKNFNTDQKPNPVMCKLLKAECCTNIASNTPATTVSHYLKVIQNYFRLAVDLNLAYKDWCSKDVHFQAAAQKCPGVRLLDQPPVENVFSFICSSNNNISRISGLVEKLCVEFGSLQCEVDGQQWFSFPSIEALAAEGVEQVLRKLAFGYRAAYIHKSARVLLSTGGEAWLAALRDAPLSHCRAQLQTLPGVGPKVADCISLMSLNKLDSIPVDTHVFQIAARLYLPALRSTKSVTERVYRTVAAHFQTLYGPHAGWAHSVLFSADLKKFAS
ncbi:N-glycosylase/DNA lyase isoform X2 [Hyalella azteca]|nr:N-glycosylase/DNA lyase isoform X2 [Hyalella azteca]